MSKVKFKYPSGINVEDEVSGIKGRITSRLQRINGCIQYCIQPRATEKEPTKIPEGYYVDEASIQPTDEGPHPRGDTYKFSYETGDKVKNRVNGAQGIITMRKLDLNACEVYVLEGPLDKDNKQKEYYCFEQEIELVDKGLNAKTEQPLKRSNTGCDSMPAPSINKFYLNN